MQNKDVINNLIYDALKEVANIGAGNAATSLSVLLGTKLEISEPVVMILDFNELVNVLGGPEKSVVGVFSELSGEVDGSLLFVMELQEAEELVKNLIVDEKVWYSEMGISAINEIANILISSYIASIETLTNNKMRIGQPQLCIDMAGAILSVAALEFGHDGDTALFIDSQLKTGDKSINGIIMMITKPNSFDNILKSMGVEISNG